MKSVNEFCEGLRRVGQADEQPNKNGATVTRYHCDDERYTIDFADDFTAEGWLQFDTDQDAHYFGLWVNPKTRTTLCYCEGDWILVDCPTVESYNAEIRGACEFHGEGRIALVIHESGAATEFRQDRATMFFATEGGAV